MQYKRLAAGYTYGYNLSQFARQSQQLALAIEQLQSQNPDAKIELSGSGANGAMAAAAVFIAEQLAADGRADF